MSNVPNIPAKTALYIGPGLRVEGRVIQNSKDEAIVVAGTLAGDIISDGTVLVEKGGLIEAMNELRCFDLRVRGKVKGEDVAVEAGLLHLESTAVVEVGVVNLPLGGLEQGRGSVLCAKIVMTQENSFAKDERLVTPTKDSKLPEVALDRPAQTAAALSQMRVNAPSAGQVTPTASTPSSASSSSVPAPSGSTSSAPASSAPSAPAPSPSSAASALSGAARVVTLPPAVSSRPTSAPSSESAFADDKANEGAKL